MAIANLQPINIGQPNNPANSDSLYTAFNVIQNNFTILANTGSTLTNIVAGGGINVNSNATTATITNAGVTQIVAGYGISNVGAGTGVVSLSIDANALANAAGNITAGISNIGMIGTNSNISVSPAFISGSGAVGNFTIDLKQQPSVTAGVYSNPNITVGKTGVITAISNGAALGLSNVILTPVGSGLDVQGSLPVSGTQTITIQNTGVTSLTAGAGITLTAPNGDITISATGGGGSGGGTGTVTAIGIKSNTFTVSPPTQIQSAGNLTVDLPSGWGWNNSLVTTSGTNYMNVAGNINANNISATLLTGTLASSSNSQPNITTVGTLGNLIVSGNANIGNIGVGNISATSLTVSGGVTTITSANITTANIGALTVNGATTLTSITANGIISTNTSGIFGSLTSNTTISATGNISTSNNIFAGINFSAYANGFVSAVNIAAPTITSNAITSNNLTVNTGVVNFASTGNVTLGAVANLHITGGTSGQVLTTDGSGTLTWATTAAGYGNSNVATYLPNYGGNFGNSNASGATVFASTISVQDVIFSNLITSGVGGDISGVDAISANSLTLSNIATIGNINAGNANASGILRVTNATDSTGITVGAAVISGGMGVASNVYIGKNITANGSLSIAGNAQITGNVVLNDKLTVANAFLLDDNATINGNLVVAGGSNISLSTTGNFYVSTNGNATIDSPLIVNGDANVTGNANLQGRTTIANLQATVTANADTVSGNLVNVTINGTVYRLLAK